MPEEPEITPEELASFRRCTFARRVFTTYPSLWAKSPLSNNELPPDSRDEETEWHASKPYNGEPFDPEEWELRDGGWDHEHCNVCYFKIIDGVSYWPNIDPVKGGQVDLCEACYPRVMSLLGLAPVS